MDSAPQPPAQEEDPTEDILYTLKKDRAKLLGEMYKKLSGLYALERDVLISRAIKKGYMTAYQMADASGLTPASVYKIIERVENGEYGKEILEYE